MDIWVLTIISEQGTTPPRRTWKYATIQKKASHSISILSSYSYTSVSLTVLLGGEGDASRRPGALTVAGHHRTGVGGVWREAGHCEWVWLGGGLGEGGGGGGAGECVAGDDSITQSHRWRGPGEVHLSLSSSCHKHLWNTSWGCEHIATYIYVYSTC